MLRGIRVSDQGRLQGQWASPGGAASWSTSVCWLDSNSRASFG
jgi:hypothetical protein